MRVSYLVPSNKQWVSIFTIEPSIICAIYFILAIVAIKYKVTN